MSERTASEPSPELTIEEYERLQESDEYRSELVRGRVVREPRPGAWHGKSQLDLGQSLNEFVKREGLGSVLTDVGFVVPGLHRTVRGPDVAFYSFDRLPAPLPRGFPHVAPELAVEVLSPGNTLAEILEKVMEYLDAGVRLIWVVDPSSRSATVYRSRSDIRLLGEDEWLEGEDVLPRFRVRLGEVLP